MSDLESSRKSRVEPSQLSVFVQHANSYVGRAMVEALTKARYTVYGDTISPKIYETPLYGELPQFELVSSVDDVYALCNAFIFNIRNDQKTALQAFSRFESVQTEIKVVLISSLMTWSLSNSSEALTGDDFRKRKPHPNFKKIYETELKAIKLAKENPKVDVYVLTAGIIYGNGEDLLFPLFKTSWIQKFNEGVGLREPIPTIGEGNNIVPMVHVTDLGSLLISTLKGEMIDKFIMCVDKVPSTLKDITASIAKVFSTGAVQTYQADQALTLPWMTEELLDYLTSNISVVNELLIRVPIVSENFMISIEKVAKEFIEYRNLHPHRILVCGPPLAGKSYFSKKISDLYTLPLITAENVIQEAKENKSGLYQAYQPQLQYEITPNLLLDLMKLKLKDISCRNQGYVLAGTPSNFDFAEALFSDGLPPVTAVIELESSDGFLRERAKNDPSVLLGIANTDEFEERLAQYRDTNGMNDKHVFFAFDVKQTNGITVKVDKDNILEAIFSFIGKPRNFGKKPGLILRESEVQLRLKKKKEEELMKIEKQMKEAAIAKQKEKEELIQRQRAKIEEEETRLLVKYSKKQREWLIDKIAPTLADGLWTLIKEMPDDPIQALGYYIAQQLDQEKQAILGDEFGDEETEEDEYEEELI